MKCVEGNKKSIRFYERVGAERREEWVKMVLEGLVLM